MRLDISENNIIPNVTRWLILGRQVEYEKDTGLSGFDTSILNGLGCVLFRDVLAISVFLFDL